MPQFQADSHCPAPGKPPLYFQHEGHSRAIVGIERRETGNHGHDYNLLILDPSVPARDLAFDLTRKLNWQVWKKIWKICFSKHG